MLKRSGGVTTRNQHEAKGFLFDRAAVIEYYPKQPNLMAARPQEAGDSENGMPGGVVLFRPALGGMLMLRAHVGRAFGLRKGRILQILERSEARIGGTVQPASTDEASVDFASRAERLLCQEIIASGRAVGHADAAQPVPYATIFPGGPTDNDVTAPAATGSIVAAQIRKQRPGPKPDDHSKLYRIIIDTIGYSGKYSGGGPEILLDDDSLSKIVAAADSKGIKPPGRPVAG